MLRAGCLIVVMVLGGCGSYVERADATCRSYGAQPGSDAYVNCRVALDNQRAARSAALIKAGAIIAASQPAPPPPRPVTMCSMRPFGSTIYTTCY